MSSLSIKDVEGHKTDDEHTAQPEIPLIMKNGTLVILFSLLWLKSLISVL